MAQLRIHRSRRVELLGGIELFAECNKTELGRVASLTTEHRREAGALLTTQGAPGLEAFVIVEGEASVTRNDRTVAKLGPGSLFGELALLDGDRRTATVVAETDVRLLVLSRREFSSLLDAAPSIGRKIIFQLGRRLRMTDELLDSVPAVANTIGAISILIGPFIPKWRCDHTGRLTRVRVMGLQLIDGAQPVELCMRACRRSLLVTESKREDTNTYLIRPIRRSP